ncbi:Peroxisomal biogenesis factor 3 [Caenorhabditis elegans]|uniref:Peroxisomal biogenesis factor 3 n=1 Tax=Caenorhabditis elegans TaxID=6239 RepID=Q18028_CAEEL|nr:Peroxisomal assembly protein PEX3 [Caenorhabditis elegans]CCD64637.1 Peroxisomal assembly protein PEX3 [Caenorhabditis elegans]|eukprot:NP_001123111.1 PeRoXisome assembly factor [Caenorhabditis elegans]
MLASAWEFAKRNKGKIIAGGVLVGSAIAYVQSSSRPKTLEKVSTSSELPNQARRHYIFDSTHRSCDQSITDLIPSIVTQIQARFDVESIQEKLQNTPDLTAEQKMQLWEQLKKNAFCRIVSVAFGFSILTLTLKAQISILAADTCSQFEQRNKKPTWQNYIPESMNSMWNSRTGSNGLSPTDNPMDVGNRRIFLQCVQYFTLRGIPELMEYVAEAIPNELQNWKLTDIKSKTEMRDFFDRVSYRISFNGLLTKLVAPLDGDGQDNSSSVMKLLQKLTTNLESSKSIHVLNSLLDFYFSAALKMVENDEQPLVKYVPAFSNSFPILTSTAFDSPLFNSLYSSDIHQFAVYVFNS